MAYKRLRLRRINRLTENGYSRQEARQLTAMKTVNPDGSVRISTIILSRPYVRLMMRERRRKYRQAQRDGISQAEFRRRISQEYIGKGWITPEGSPDYWREFRFFYKQSVRLGLYKPPPERRTYDPSKPHKKVVGEQIDRVHVKKQRAKYQEWDRTKTRAEMGDKSEWIKQLRVSMEEAKTPEQKEQFRKQIERLGGTP